MESLILILYILISSTLCDARSLSQTQKAEQHRSTTQILKKLKVTNHIDIPVVQASSPFSSPPSVSPAPNPLPTATVPPNLPYCVNPQLPPTILSPTYPPQNGPSPHQPCIILSPPNNTPTQPNIPLSPPISPLSPPAVNPFPTVNSPPPTGPKNTPPHTKPQSGVWCVAKPTVPDPIVQAAMDYACGSGADCKSIQPNGSCYHPETLLSHASYAFNNYWQRRKVAGGTCDFGGTAMLVTADPSFDGCQFSFNG
ncbi:putative X8 domain-containing protein [Rosa chinensis]|uniref:Putative X8 domain-containing protein n=1 Tax=Rosa chinensis TaxID=74649 RepID=A0A2P6S0L7_ROSCH|nr:classical arabinogalactan protein 9 [Rosa chinensis]PRQ52228.1 putative X8 domain-containing protein [Rosa chinensis]